MSAQVTELGYVGIGVRDPEAWKTFASEIVGMEVLDEGERDRFYFRLDNWHHRIAVDVNGDDDLLYVGWRVPWPEDFEAIATRLSDAGVAFRVGDKNEAEERRVLGLLKLTDPGGNPTEIFYGPQVDSYRPFRPGRGMHGRFVTGSQGMGHLILREDDVEAAYQFYQALGFKGSIDRRFSQPDGTRTTPVFMHCSDRQHSLGFGLSPMSKRIHHLMLEYAQLDDLAWRTTSSIDGKSTSRCTWASTRTTRLTFYAATPSGWLIELAWGARATPAQHEYSVSDIFGHHLGATGYGFDALDIGHGSKRGAKKER